jgi:CHAT domain-containing protein
MQTLPARRQIRRIAFALVLALNACSRPSNPTTALIAAAGMVDQRANEGRIALAVDYRPFRRSEGQAQARLISTASDAEARWRLEPTPFHARLAGVSLLLAGKTDAAIAHLAEALQQATGEPDLLDAIHHSIDAALLNDFGAAMIQRREDPRATLLALEAADRAWTLRPTAQSAWNRALALGRIGLADGAHAAWAEAAARSGPTGWAQEASRRGRATAPREAVPVPETVETYVEHWLIDLARGDPARIGLGPVKGDHLVSDTARALRGLAPNEHVRAQAALADFAKARAAFEEEHFAEAHAGFAAAEKELARLRVPLALLAKDGWIRCECSQAAPKCLEHISALHASVVGSGRYPWLAARVAWAKGQTYYRRGRMYEAVEWFKVALDGFQKTGDRASEQFLHSLLGNAYIAAGESDLALSTYLEALRGQSQDNGDRRRRILEGVARFTLRHGYLSATASLLDELAPLPTTIAGKIAEERFRGILCARRGEAGQAAEHFARARGLLAEVSDPADRADQRMNIAIAAAAAPPMTSPRVLGEIDDAIATHQGVDNSIWLPQLLLGRGEALERRNETARAERDYLRAIEILEQREPRIDQTMMALGLGVDTESPFDRAIRLLLRQGRAADALAIAERAAAVRISSLSGQAEGIRDPFRSAPAPRPKDPAGALRQCLQPNETAVVYYLLRDELVTWVVSREDILFFRRGVGRPAVVAAVERVLQCARSARCGRSEPSAALSELLLQPWIDRIAANTTLLMVPPPELPTVPFAMLETSSGGLLARHAVATAPSLGAFVRAIRQDHERAGAVSAFFAAAPNPGGELPPLYEAIREVSKSARYYPDAVVATHITHRDFLSRSPHFAVIHFAGHILVNEEQPLRSALAFDRDDLLYVHELNERSFARARLFVLSGCDSGQLPRPTMSIANALLAQNVPSIVYTLWPVADDAARYRRRSFASECRARGATRNAARGASRGELGRVRDSRNIRPSNGERGEQP